MSTEESTQVRNPMCALTVGKLSVADLPYKHIVELTVVKNHLSVANVGRASCASHSCHLTNKFTLVRILRSYVPVCVCAL